MGREAGGREYLGFIRTDVKNYLRTKHQKNLKFGDAGSILAYFESQRKEDKGFFASMQLDNEEQLTNIFWADGKMIDDYSLFGDVVSFDTTYCTNKEYMPFGVFVGVNHHRTVFIFGATLLYDETAASFNWLFSSFLEAHRQKAPKTIFIDQDAAMGKAIPEVFPNTWHGLCSWHISQNVVKNLAKCCDGISSFLHDFSACMYKYSSEVVFESAWIKMRKEHRLEENDWLDGIYRLKHKWAQCYMLDTVTLGIRSTQLSESLNASIKDYLGVKVDIMRFFHHFNRVVDDKRYNELLAEFNAVEKVASNLVSKDEFARVPILRHAYSTYTPKIFELFCTKYKLHGACNVKPCVEDEYLQEYLVSLYDEGIEYKVVWNPIKSEIQCSCRKFEMVGILCVHALKIMDRNGLKNILDTYIVKRWTRSARRFLVENDLFISQKENPTLDSTRRYRLICSQMVKLAVKASETSEGFAMARKLITELATSLDAMFTDKNAVNIQQNNLIEGHVKGSKRKDNGDPNHTRRLKSWVEKGRKKAKSIHLGERNKTLLSCKVTSKKKAKQNIGKRIENVEIPQIQVSTPNSWVAGQAQLFPFIIPSVYPQ